MIIFLFSVGALFGCGLTLLFIYLLSKRFDKKLRDKTTNRFIDVLDKFKNNQVRFDCRLNHVVQFSLSIPDEGDIQLIYFIDKHELTIFKTHKVIYTSINLDIEVMDDIMNQIWSKFSNQINDTVQVYNFTYDRASFLKVSEIHRQQDVHNDTPYEIQTYDLDEILDKINEIGYDNLDESEKEFLKKYKND